MYVPFSWLKKFVNLDCSVNEFVDKMTMTGSKVESVKFLGEKISGIVVGKILEIKKHPNADKLVITKVDIGKEILQIITGATNIFENAIVPVAVHNSFLCDGTKIKKNKLRGEWSQGMLCSIEELGYTKNQYPEAPDNGIYIFKDDVELGADVREILELTEDVIDFEITTNRPDCLSIFGIAREAAATFDKKLNYPLCEDLSIKNDLDIEVRNSDLCKRYMAQIIENVKIEPSPQWLRHRLISCGINPINNILDITNYVMLETGQPLHAFDATYISHDKIIVRTAENGMLKTLDGVQRNLTNDMLVIADPEKILAVAGVMGGESSKINAATKKIMIESANFDGYSVRQTSKKLNLRTDASMRYEKNLDPNLTEFAMKRVIYLIKKLNCGEILSPTFDFYPIRNNSRQIKLNPDKINGLLGTNISAQEMIDILEKIELRVENGFIIVPTFRNDLENDADIAEEILRFYGYDKIPFTLPASKNIGGKSKKQMLYDKIKNILVAHAAFEMKNFSFESPKAAEKCMLENANAVKILNPLGEEFLIMRTNTIDAALRCMSFNLNQKNNDLILFEIGKIFENRKNDLPTEKEFLTIIASGENDFFVLKGIIVSLFEQLKINNFDFKNGDKKFLHPFRQANIFINEETVGYLGEVHSQVSKNYDIKHRIYLATIDLEYICKSACDFVKFKPLPKFPAISRDIALLVNKNISSKSLCDTILKFSDNNLEDVKLFDVYEGKQIANNMKSLAYKLIFRACDRTLTENEINSVMQKIIDALKSEHDAILR